MKNRVFGPEWLKQIAQLKVDEANPFALPPDIELSVEDAKRKWAASSFFIYLRPRVAIEPTRRFRMRE